MGRFGEKEIAKEKFYAAKKPIKIWDVNFGNAVISKLVKTKTNSKYLIGIKFDKALRPLVLIMPEKSRYDKTFNVKEGDKDKNNKLMSSHIDGEKLLEKYKAIWPKFEILKNIGLNALPAHDDRYTKTKIRTCSNKVYTTFCDLNVPEDHIVCDSFRVISIDSLLVYENKYYLQIHLDNFVYKTVNKQMTVYLDENLFED